MKRICSICARGGSKGVKNKNIRLLAGKPLIAHSIEQAKASGCFDCIAVSSDSQEILDIAEEWGAEYLISRPEELASDHAAKLPVIQHCVHEAERINGYTFDTMVDLDATSPLRSIDDILGSIKMLEESQSSNLITASPARRSPYFNLIELNEGGFVRRSKSLDQPIFRRQDSPKCFDMNASVYIWKRDGFFENTKVLLEDTLLFIMPEERSLDIDSELDFEMVEFLIQKKGIAL
jgi:CMP-N,N'-diacetyllegionaminic acid synthase